MSTFIESQQVQVQESSSPFISTEKAASAEHELGAEFSLYRRIDEEMLEANPKFAEKNAVHGVLSAPGLVPRYEVYEKTGTQEIAVIVQVDDRLCGHPGIVHGGIISTLFDNSFGWLFIAAKQKPAFTANLTITYRKPIMANTKGVIKATITEIQGRKLYMSARWEWAGEVYAEATSLFIIPKTEITPA